MPRDPLGFDYQVVLTNVRRATTEDLLNRITAYRAGMEPEAVELIEAELCSRGVTAEQIAAHAERVEREAILLADGIAARCSFCHAPAVGTGWRWFRLLRLVPIFPRLVYLCREHGAALPTGGDDRSRPNSA